MIFIFHWSRQSWPSNKSSQKYRLTPDCYLFLNFSSDSHKSSVSFPEIFYSKHCLFIKTKAFAVGTTGARVFFCFVLFHFLFSDSALKNQIHVICKIRKVSKFESCILLNVIVQTLVLMKLGFARGQFWKILFWEALKKWDGELKGGQMPICGQKTSCE